MFSVVVNIVLSPGTLGGSKTRSPSRPHLACREYPGSPADLWLHQIPSVPQCPGGRSVRQDLQAPVALFVGTMTSA